MLLGTLGASLLGNVLGDKGVITAEEGTAKVDYGSKGSLFLPHPFTNFEIQMCYQNEPRLNGVYSRDDLTDKIKDGVHVTNLDEYSDIRTHWITLYLNTKTVTYFNSSGVENIPNKIRNFINNNNIIANIFRIQAYDSIMCGYYCIGFTIFMFKGNSLTDFTDFFSEDNFKENDDILLNYFLSNF